MGNVSSQLYSKGESAEDRSRNKGICVQHLWMVMGCSAPRVHVASFPGLHIRYFRYEIRAEGPFYHVMRAAASITTILLESMSYM